MWWPWNNRLVKWVGVCSIDVKCLNWQLAVIVHCLNKNLQFRQAGLISMVGRICRTSEFWVPINPHFHELWTFRSQDHSLPGGSSRCGRNCGLFKLNSLHYLLTYLLNDGTTHTVGTSIPCSIRWWERKFHSWTFAPGLRCESSREQKFSGAKVPGSESSTLGTF